MLKKKKIDNIDAQLNKQENMTIDINKKEENVNNFLDNGMCSLKDLLAPTSIDRSHPDYIAIGKKCVRSFIMQGFPQQAYVGWLNDIYHNQGDIDTIIHIDPADDRTAIDTLTAKIAQFESQLAIEKEKGNIRNLTSLNDTIQGLYAERRKLERNSEKLYQIQIACNLYADSKEELDKETQKFDNTLRGKKIYMMPPYLRQEDAYKTCLPFGKSYVEDMFRNFNSGALTGCFPFYNSNVFHTTGVFCGVNLHTWTPTMIDFYDRSKLNNSNITVLGQAGTGKTFFVSLLTMRSVTRKIKTVIVDPEGEYAKLTKALHGVHIYLAPDSKDCFNPFDIEESDIVDDDGFPIGGKEVLVKEKASDLLNLIALMAKGLGTEQSIVSDILVNLYYDRGINEDPKSLYVAETFFDDATKTLFHDGMKKPMPTFSDFWEKLDEFGRVNENEKIQDLSNDLKMFKKGGVYDMFDTHTSSEIADFANAPLVTFDVSKLDGTSILRPLGMYVALTWTWEKFVKKNPHVKKRVVCDEAWMLVSTNMAGWEFTATFLEQASRRIRKRNGGLLVASQNFSEFASSKQGQAVLKNAVVNILLGQNYSDAEPLKQTFMLSDGEVQFLMTSQKGEMLVKMPGDSYAVRVIAFPNEKKLIEKERFVT